MQKKKNLGINAILNVIRQCMSVLFPIITYPYALRVLGADGIGKVSYSASIINYFTLLAMLGVTNYAIREGSKRKQQKVGFQTFFCEVFTINLFFTIISYVLLLLVVIYVHRFQPYATLLMLQSSSIVLTTLGVEWVNSVYEDYVLVTVRSIVTHIVSMILLFVFVKEPEDYYIYAFLTVVTNGIVCLSNLFNTRRYTKIRMTLRPNFKQHLKPMLVLFANSLAVTIYINVDVTMLGWMKGDYYTGLYTVAVKVYSIVKNLMCAVFSVTIPRLSFLSGNEYKDDFRKLYTDLWGYMSLLLIPVGVGLVCIAPEIMLFMGGVDFVDSALALQILALSLIAAIFGGLVTGCLNVVVGREKENLKATILSAFLNCFLNFFFIYRFAHYGAAFTTFVSEAFVFVFCFIRIKNKREYMNIVEVKASIIHAIIGAIIMGVFAYFIRSIVGGPILRIVLMIPCCILLYIVVLLLLKERLLLNILKMIKKKFSSHMTNEIEVDR